MLAKRIYHPEDEARNLSDEAAWNKFRDGDKAAFELMFKKYNPVLCYVGVKLFYDRDVVEDCIQELFLQLWNKRESLPEVKAVKYYLITSLRRLLLRNIVLLKRKTDFNNSVGSEQFRNEVPSHENDIISQLSIKEKTDQLTYAIQQLPPRQKEAVYLKFYEEKSYEEITSIMSINYQTARKFIYKGLQIIRKNLCSNP